MCKNNYYTCIFAKRTYRVHVRVCVCVCVCVYVCSVCEMQVKDQFFGSWTLYLSFGNCYKVNIMQLCFLVSINRI